MIVVSVCGNVWVPLWVGGFAAACFIVFVVCRPYIWWLWFFGCGGSGLSGEWGIDLLWFACMAV